MTKSNLTRRGVLRSGAIAGAALVKVRARHAGAHVEADALATDGATAHVHVELGDELGHRADVGHGKQRRA